MPFFFTIKMDMLLCWLLALGLLQTQSFCKKNIVEVGMPV